jgi:N-acetylmuramate 1-kinase
MGWSCPGRNGPMGTIVSRIDPFLDRTGWGGAVRQPLAGDASTRSYVRLIDQGQSAILMCVPPDGGDLIDRFLLTTGWLRGCGYSAPEVIAVDLPQGLVILEDLGDALFARLMTTDATLELPLYEAAAGFLTDLARKDVPGFVRPLDGPALGALLDVLADWYLPGCGLPAEGGRAIAATVSDLYSAFGGSEPVFSLRDFHAENLIWRPERQGTARVGLLDYQDAVAAHPAYDLVSMLQDARRDVSPGTEAAVIARYLSMNPVEESRFGRIYALLGAQRAMRILGAFARLTMAGGKPSYLRLMPRVHGYLIRSLAHPDLRGLADQVRAVLPEPTPAIQEGLRQRCRQHQTP